MSPSDAPSIVDELAAFDRLLEVGIGRRPDVARALADRACDVIAIDVDEAALATHDGPYRTGRGDVVALAEAVDPLATLPVDSDDAGFDAVYGLNLPAELQRPTVETARRLDAACAFTTLGFEEPVVPVRRRSLTEGTLYVARQRDGDDPRRSRP
ncbi:UPF0146 family protein [Halorubrum sp. DTA98]|uniref:UPF0146 family protein n=1 Tax=Halorubrum sp. DTA98 TaxID=3402163 RepID=UPI003AAD1665